MAALLLVMSHHLNPSIAAETRRWTAHLVEPHAARVVTLEFVEPREATVRNAQIQSLQARGANASLEAGRAGGANRASARARFR